MKRLLTILLTLVLVAGCADDGADTTSTTATPGTNAPETTGVPPTSAAPGTTSGEEAPTDSRVAGLAERFTLGALEQSESQATFTQEFIDAVPYPDFLPIVQQISAVGQGWSVGEFESREGNEATVLLESAD